MSEPLGVHDRPEVKDAMRKTIAASRKRGPDECAADCGVPMDPVLADQGWTRHPACEPTFRPMTPAEAIKSQLDRNRQFYIEHGCYQFTARGHLKPTPSCPPGSSMKLWAPRGGRQRGEKLAAADVERRKGGKPETLTSGTDRATQMRAALAALPRAGTRRREVYDAIAKAGRRGLTHAELSEAVNRSYSLNGPRVRELVEDGHVVRAPMTREGPSGAAQDVWVALVNVPEHARNGSIPQTPIEG